MAEDAARVVRNAMDVLARDGVEGLLGFIHEDFEMFTPPEFAAEPDTYRGPEGVRRWFDSFYEVMDRVGLEALDLVEAGSGRVVGMIRISARGGSTGIETTQETPLVCTVQNGKILGMSFFATREEALAAAESKPSAE